MTTIAGTPTTPPPPTTATTTSSTTSAATLTSNQFLSLLTTQLQNQDPLNPTDPNQFTSEMVQYGALSQQIDTNTKLDSLSTTMSSILTQVSLMAANTTPAATAAAPAAAS